MQVVVLCHVEGLGRVVLDTLRASHVQAWLIYNRMTVHALKYSRFATVLGAVDEFADHVNEIVDMINGLHRRQHVDMVLASDVDGMLVLNAIQGRLVPPIYPMPGHDALAMLNDKWNFHQLCERLGLPIPKTLCCEAAAIDFDRVTCEIGFPLIMKPTGRFGGAGVVVAQDAMELRAKATVYEYPQVVIQEYIDGVDHGLSLFARDGVVEASATFRCETRIRTEFTDLPEFTDVCCRIVEATGYSGVANFDARVNRRGELILFECNPRFFERLNAVRLAGIDLLRLGLPGLAQVPRASAAGMFFSRGDVRWLRGVLSDKTTARTMMRSWYELLCDPLPRVVLVTQRFVGMARTRFRKIW